MSEQKTQEECLRKRNDKWAQAVGTISSLRSFLELHEHTLAKMITHKQKKAVCGVEQVIDKKLSDFRKIWGELLREIDATPLSDSCPYCDRPVYGNELLAWESNGDGQIPVHFACLSSDRKRNLRVMGTTCSICGEKECRHLREAYQSDQDSEEG